MESPKRAGPLAALKGSVCLVTGGAQGIGLAITRALAHQGAQVHVAAISPDSIESANAELAATATGASVTFHLVDVSNRDAFEECIAQVHSASGRLDILVNNAAFTQWCDVADMSIEDAEQTMRTGYNAMVYGVKAALPLMRAANSGHIVNISSAAGVIFVRGPSAAYAAAKAAINAYTQILTCELADTPVHVLLVRPGAVGGTEFFGKCVPSSRMPRVADFLPVSTPAQVAAAIVNGILRRRAVVDVPGYLPWLYRAYALTPPLLAKLAALGGPAHRNFATVTAPSVAPSAHEPTLAGRASAAAAVKRLAMRLMNKAGPTVGVSTAGRLFLAPMDTVLQRYSVGRWSVGRGLGVPSLLLASTGARSGQPRQSPLFYVGHRNGFCVVGTNFGLAHHPAWTTNLLHNPHAVVITAGQRIPVTARLVEGKERDGVWAQFLDLYSGYQTYSDRSDRHLRIFHLQPSEPIFNGPLVHGEINTSDITAERPQQHPSADGP